MSKYLKNLMTDELKQRWESVSGALIVNVVGMEANSSTILRKTLRNKGIELLVVKNSLARRATEGTVLGPAFEGLEGTAAVVWGGEDIVALTKEVMRLTKDDQFASFAPRSGVMDGKLISPEEIKDVSQWPSRREQLSSLVGQILSPGATLSAQLLGPGAQLASQVKKLSDERNLSIQ